MLSLRKTFTIYTMLFFYPIFICKFLSSCSFYYSAIVFSFSFSLADYLIIMLTSIGWVKYLVINEYIQSKKYKKRNRTFFWKTIKKILLKLFKQISEIYYETPSMYNEFSILLVSSLSSIRVGYKEKEQSSAI